MHDFSFILFGLKLFIYVSLGFKTQTDEFVLFYRRLGGDLNRARPKMIFRVKREGESGNIRFYDNKTLQIPLL